MSQFLDLPLESITISKHNPRKHFDEALIKELAESIKDKGVLQPILVRPTKQKMRYELVSGERRYRASKMAGIKTIPAAVRKLTDEEAFEVMIIENLQRSDIHPLDEAAAFLELHKRPNYTLEVIAEKVGKSESYITRRLKLNELTADFKKLFFKEEINVGHAMELARLTPSDQKTAKDLLFNWSGQIKSVNELKSSISQNITLELTRAGFDTKSETLVKSAGACTNCPKRSGFNKELFPDLQKDDRCFDRTCFLSKTDAHIQEFIAEKKAEGAPYAVLLQGYSNAPKAYPKALPYDKYNLTRNQKCAHQVEGIYVSGDKIGSKETVCTEKTCKTHWPVYSNYSSVPSDPLEKLKYRKVRGRQLDQEKIQAKISEQLGQSDYLKQVPVGQTELEAKALFCFAVDKANWGLSDAFREILGAKGNHDLTQNIVAKKWDQLEEGQKALMIRKLVFSEYSNRSSGIEAELITSMAKDAGIDVAAIEAEQLEVRKKREARIKKQMDELETKPTPKQEEKIKKSNKKWLKEKGYPTTAEE